MAMSRLITLVVTITIFISSTLTANASPKEDAEKLVRSAIAFYKANDFDKTFAEVVNYSGQFRKGNIYVFIYDKEGVMTAHPDMALIGKNLIATPDSKGKLFRKEIIETVKAKGECLVDYVYYNSKTNKEENKTTYCAGHEDLVFCSGFYR